MAWIKSFRFKQSKMERNHFRITVKLAEPWWLLKIGISVKTVPVTVSISFTLSYSVNV